MPSHRCRRTAQFVLIFDTIFSKKISTQFFIIIRLYQNLNTCTTSNRTVNFRCKCYCSPCNEKHPSCIHVLHAGSTESNSSLLFRQATLC